MGQGRGAACVELLWWPVVGCQSGHHREKAIPAREDITIAWLADSFRALIEKSMSICASSSPGRLPARLKSPNEAWSRYLIPDSLSQSDFAAEVIHPSGTYRGRVQHDPCSMLLLLFQFAFSCSCWCWAASCRPADLQGLLIACSQRRVKVIA